MSAVQPQHPDQPPATGSIVGIAGGVVDVRFTGDLPPVNHKLTTGERG